MKKTILLMAITMGGILPAFSQGYINFTYTGNTFTTGLQVGANSNPSSQQPGWYLGNDYSVEAYMAAGNGAAEGSLSAVAASLIAMGFQALPTSAAGGPGTDGSGLFQGGAVNTGLAIGPGTIQVRVWYNPNHNMDYASAAASGVNNGKSALYNITTVANSDPTIKSLDDVGLAAFTVSGTSVIPEPSTFALAGLGAAAMLIFRRRK